MVEPLPPKTIDEFLARAETLRKLAARLKPGDPRQNALTMAARYEATAVEMVAALRGKTEPR